MGYESATQFSRDYARVFGIPLPEMRREFSVRRDSADGENQGSSKSPGAGKDGRASVYPITYRDYKIISAVKAKRC